MTDDREYFTFPISPGKIWIGWWNIFWPPCSKCRSVQINNKHFNRLL